VGATGLGNVRARSVDPAALGASRISKWKRSAGPNGNGAAKADTVDTTIDYIVKLYKIIVRC